jgi:hypothetical protein
MWVNVTRMTLINNIRQRKAIGYHHLPAVKGGSNNLIH